LRTAASQVYRFRRVRCRVAATRRRTCALPAADAQGSRYKTKYADADVIYPDLFAALAELGASPSMEDARLRMRKAGEAIGRE
jgi:hypothetical protein